MQMLTSAGPRVRLARPDLDALEPMIAGVLRYLLANRGAEVQIAQDPGGRVVAVDADGAGPLVPEEREGGLGREVRRVDLVKGEASGRAEKRLRVSQDRFGSGVRENIDAGRDVPVPAPEIMKQHEKLPGEDADLEHRSFDVRGVLAVEHIGGKIGRVGVEPAGQLGQARFDETAVVRSEETGLRLAPLPGIDGRMLRGRRGD